MTTKFFLILFLSLSLFLNSCGSGGGSNIASSIDSVINGEGGSDGFSLEEKEFVHSLFSTEYLWFEQVPANINYAKYTEPQSMIDALRVDPPDVWSFTMTQEEYENYNNQKTAGFGFGYKSDFTIYLVRINAPAYELLYRGDEILEINGQEVTSTLIKESSDDLNTATTFTLLRDGSEIDVTVTPREYTFSVSLGEIITQGTQKVGYLRYDAFTESSVAELEAIFTTFHNANIDELVIDMRYNGGGSVATASVLLDNINNAYPGKRQMYLDWNFNYQQNNSAYTFEDADLQDGNELTMSRVFFLTSKGSASASEAVINALVPYLGDANIITIGDVTHGKPVGMTGRTYGLNYYFLINFLVKNNAAETTSFDGILVTCAAEDDLTHLRGDANETMFKTALSYIETGGCP
ncbi:MAG: hypothetical protein COB07_09980 [Sulfurovum sp.]|nr:MAG: hypothetical protein COB07_09980 [Sulfurovum sp.]